MLAHAHSLDEAADELLEGICTALGWDLGALWTRRANPDHLRCEFVWFPTGERYASFEAACRAQAFGPGDGLPGRVWNSSKPEWVPDFPEDGNLPRKTEAAAVDLHGAFAFPIFVNGSFYGAMEFFSRDAQQPDPLLLEILETIGAQIGDLIASELVEQELVFQKALLESMGEASLDGILLVSTEQRVLYWNTRLIDMWGIGEDVLRIGDAFEVNTHLAPKAADPAIFDELARAIREDPSLTRRDQILLADGRVFDRWTSPVRSANGERLGRTVNYRDITTEKMYEARLEREEQWSSYLAEASALLSESLDVETILDRLVHLAVPTLADWCSVHLVDERENAQPLAFAHIDPDKVELARMMQERYPPDPSVETGVHGVIRSRTPLLMSDVPRELLVEAAIDDEHLSFIESLDIRSAIIVPIVCRDRALGAFTLVGAESARRYEEDDMNRAMELADRAAFPIDNARLYAQTQLVAQTLQRSFLPPELPKIPGVDISARYFPAGELIGGDFYDAYPVDGKRWGLVLGDVSGKGIEAATVTTVARHTIRGAAFSADRPSDALRVLNSALLEQQQTDRFCTAVYAIVEPRFARVKVTISCGGHPPPYIIRNNGTVEAVEASGTLLGFMEDVSLRDAEVELEFGDKLFLYTDGVLDIRQKTGMFGEEGLARLLNECAKRGTESAAAHISERLIELQAGEPTDDIAFILIGVRSSVFNVATRRRIKGNAKA